MKVYNKLAGLYHDGTALEGQSRDSDQLKMRGKRPKYVETTTKTTLTRLFKPILNCHAPSEGPSR